MSPSQRTLPFIQFDVFASRPLEGNPLAVFPDGRGLTDHEMQAIAREMNLSETTFVFPRPAATEGERGVRVRIFTVQEELPFAGHPTLGTAFALHREKGTREIRLELNVGTVPVLFQHASDEPPFGEMLQPDPTFGELHPRERIAEVSGIPREDIDPNLPIQTVSTGVPFTILPLRNLDAMRRLNLDRERSARYLRETGSSFFFCVTRETVDPTAGLHARMLSYNGEDPATGSASGCAAAWMVEHGLAAADQQVLIEQGLEMGRPSRIFIRASRHSNRVVNVRVGGNVVEVLRGELFL